MGPPEPQHRSEEIEQRQHDRDDESAAHMPSELQVLERLNFVHEPQVQQDRQHPDAEPNPDVQERVFERRVADRDHSRIDKVGPTRPGKMKQENIREKRGDRRLTSIRVRSCRFPGNRGSHESPQSSRFVAHMSV